MKKAVPLLAGTFFLYALVIFLWRDARNFDTVSYNVIGVLTSHGKSIYPDPAISRHPYLPLFLYLEWGSLLAARILPVSQAVVLKIVFSLFHLFSVCSLYLLSGRDMKKTLLYALNPISLFTIAFHGQFDIIPLSLLLYAMVLLKRKRYLPVVMLLSVAVTIKTWPVLFIVPFFRKIPRKWWPAIAVIPASTILLYSLLFRTQLVSVVRVILVYQGVAGIWGLGKLFSLLEAPRMFLLAYKAVFVCALFAYSYFNKKGPLLEQVYRIMIFFFVFTPGFGIQWILWLVPFLFLSKLPYSLGLYVPFFLAVLLSYASWLFPQAIHDNTVSLILFATSFLLPLYCLFLAFVVPSRKAAKIARSGK